MAILTRSALTALFDDGCRPTGQNFADLLESFRHISEGIPLSAVIGLTDAVNGKAETAAFEEHISNTTAHMTPTMYNNVVHAIAALASYATAIAAKASQTDLNTETAAREAGDTESQTALATHTADDSRHVTDSLTTQIQEALGIRAINVEAEGLNVMEDTVFEGIVFSGAGEITCTDCCVIFERCTFEVNVTMTDCTGELDGCAFRGARLTLTTSDSIMTNGNIDSSLLVLSDNNTSLKKHITDCSFTGSSVTGDVPAMVIDQDDWCITNCRFAPSTEGYTYRCAIYLSGNYCRIDNCHVEGLACGVAVVGRWCHVTNNNIRTDIGYSESSIGVAIGDVVAANVSGNVIAATIAISAILGEITIQKNAISAAYELAATSSCTFIGDLSTSGNYAQLTYTESGSYTIAVPTNYSFAAATIPISAVSLPIPYTVANMAALPLVYNNENSSTPDGIAKGTVVYMADDYKILYYDGNLHWRNALGVSIYMWSSDVQRYIVG